LKTFSKGLLELENMGYSFLVQLAAYAIPLRVVGDPLSIPKSIGDANPR
jgi:hypothetical protein